MEILRAAILVLACTLARDDVPACVQSHWQDQGTVAGAQSNAPEFTGQALDVVLTAKAALVWDVSSNTVLYEKAADEERPVASLTKLVSMLAVRNLLAQSDVVEIPSAVRRAQLQGANIKLPIGEHASVADLSAASLIASANDAMVALAVASSGSEEAFVTEANRYAYATGLTHTRLVNATGLSQPAPSEDSSSNSLVTPKQYSTAHDIMRALQRVYADRNLGPYLSSGKGVLRTQEGTVRSYVTTDQLLGTYLPILAAKTGYTVEAGQNLAIITKDSAGHEIGAVVLGSDQRFQDMKILIEWILRNYTWSTP